MEIGLFSTISSDNSCSASFLSISSSFSNLLPHHYALKKISDCLFSSVYFGFFFILLAIVRGLFFWNFFRIRFWIYYSLAFICSVLYSLQSLHFQEREEIQRHFMTCPRFLGLYKQVADLGLKPDPWLQATPRGLWKTGCFQGTFQE